MAAQNQPTDFTKSLSEEATANALLLAGSQLMRSSQVYSKGNIEEKFGHPEVIDKPSQHTGENLRLGNLFELNQNTTSSSARDYSHNVTTENSKVEFAEANQPVIFSSFFLNKLSITDFAPSVNVEERTAEEIASPVIYRDDSETISGAGFTSGYATVSPVLETFSLIIQPSPNQAETQTNPSLTGLIANNSPTLTVNNLTVDNQAPADDANANNAKTPPPQAPTPDNNSTDIRFNGDSQVSESDSNTITNNTEEAAPPAQVDATPPNKPAMSSINSGGETTSDNTLVFSGTAEANSSVEVFIDGVSIGTTSADGSGNWSVDHTGTTLADGNYTITARATDAAGNVSALSSGLPVTIDTTNPTFNNAVFSLTENSASGTAVGTANGTDATTLSYSFSNDTQTSSDGYFQIDANTGAITLTAAGAAADLLNYEAGANSVQHNVKTTDLAGNQTTAQVTINITDVNEAPTTANNTVTAIEDTTYTFSAGNFKFTDVDAGSSLASVKITSLPASGQLLLNGSTVSINDEISLSDINNNLLTYQPASGISGSQSAIFNYQVSDGNNWSSNSAQMDIDILNTITGTNPASQSSNITVDVNNYTTTNQGFQVTGQKINSSTGVLEAGSLDTFSNQGFGVDASTSGNESNTKVEEIGYDTTWNKSEVVTIDFDQDMADATVSYARLHASKDEIGHWDAYKDGVLVGQGDFTASNGHQGNFNVAIGGGFDQLQFTAKLQDGGPLGSSYLIDSITGNTVAQPTGGNDNLTGTAAGDYISGLGGNDILSGGGSDDLIIGGSGTDTMTGGTGADTFDWNVNDQGTVASPTTDTIMDFNIAENDVLHLQDLLVGETQGTLDQFLTVSASGGDTTIDVAHTGNGQVTQKIVLDNVDLTTHYGTSNSSTIISNLISDGSLITD
ncbi:type I secretion C-terminal target domain-containing protein [Endozoicomonas sp. SM1973]|uniref:Type I secretion C-terminal target domain-containing protein n=1 Tax=Spartinivicinus marinus TaxID=2994442 RepID=A0A853I0A0_9GAMM|nr:type I secretion C-terminal target domain-containing protein [Spartinivicinus marinus]MCX4026481.1 type I secretion C-terminal target domain-containing protein [Spartinivicinus marinus]NYZ66853.1 type I secretion C-terminal target domain-containing protein [Spartinivicinus marinus]